MASALYLENFLESKPGSLLSFVVLPSPFLLVLFLFAPDIENLPTELQRNFTLMRSLDQRAQGTSQDVQCTLPCGCDAFYTGKQ